MRIWIISDLHLEFGWPFDELPPDKADVLICAGDVLTKGVVPSIKWLAKFAPDVPIVFVAGNHEFYNSCLHSDIPEARKAARDHPRLHFLENDAVDIGGIRFVGGTLWTDFRLFGRNPGVSMSYAQSGINDFKKIKFSKTPYLKFKPIHAYGKHVETRDYIAAELRERTGRKTVVVTHHAPSPRSIDPAFRHDPLSGCYASDLEDLVYETGPALWVHGHVHHRNDYMVGSTRVVSNSRGYPGERTGFDPGLVIEI
ncbi:phosphatase [Rhizobium sp. P32RR-XVIII]|uniref:metallophosphoesterase n=1 Tax=Rhizobium sp. P32RR-XVIII TaxID=2726738 RepID=UPI00145782C0|nr:metallophosphoesterase [Rhizobium sp. P32RR-XVIII]NLS07659.1 phosphatase [Rhizobium sp. P32RR-XVIII]